MKLIALKEFQKLAGLSDSALLWLLVNNKLILSLEQNTGIMVDIDSAEINSVVEAIARKHEELLAEKKELLAERFGAIIGEQLEEIIDEAMDKLLRAKNAA